MALNFDYGLTDSTYSLQRVYFVEYGNSLGNFDLIRSVPKRSVRMNPNPSLVGLALGAAVVDLLGGVQQHHRLEHVGQLLNQGLKPK